MEYIRLEKKGPVGVITLCNEKALNALKIELLKELDEALGLIENDGDIKALIITGAGEKAFAAGANLSDMKDMTPEEALEYSRFGTGVFRRIEELDIPVIAAVNGYALGGGCELTMCADIRIAADTAVFAQPEVGLGVIPGFGGTQRLSRLVGMSRAKALIFTCERITAARAMEIGLVDRVAEKANLMTEALALAEKIAGMPETAVKCAKKAVAQGFERDFNTALETESRYFSKCFECGDPNRLMNAFLNRKK
jgi:enoyl-CoA hydratase